MKVIGNIELDGLVDGRDVSIDGVKLDTIETSATADQTDTEIETAYNNQVAIVSQIDAEEGTSTTVVRWTPERVAQAVGASGLTLLGGESGGIVGDLNGNVTYSETVAVVGAVIGDTFDCGYNNVFASELVSTNQAHSELAIVTTADQVVISFRISSFLSADTSRKVWCRIVK